MNNSDNTDYTYVNNGYMENWYPHPPYLPYNPNEVRPTEQMYGYDYKDIHHLQNKNDTNDIIKKYTRLCKTWLDLHWFKLYAYFVVEDGKVRLVTSKSEYKDNSDKKLEHIDAKRAYFMEYILSKKNIRKFLKRFTETYKILWIDLHLFEDLLIKYIHSKIKYKLKKKIKEKRKSSQN